MKITFILLVLMLCIYHPTIGQDTPTNKELETQEETNQEEDSQSISLSGSIDVYYRANFTGDKDVAPSTSFANLPGFSLGMANFIASHEGKNFGFTADIVLGPRGEDATFLSSLLRPGGSSNVVNQLYAFWNVNDALTLTLGNFNTFLGYEVISPTGNFNYSTSYMFSYGPFSHTGLKADYQFNDEFSLMAGVFNPTDATEYNPSNEYAFGIQLGYDNGALNIWLNSLASKDYVQFDITAGYDLTETVYLGINATTALDNFTGIAGYFQVATSDDLTLGLRVENFQDNGLGLFTEEEQVLDFTLSANYQIGKLMLIPELRLDFFSENVIPNDTQYIDTLSSFVLAAVYNM